jgi:DNA modification methylase
MSVDIIQSDARRIPLADESVQCCVTSPPYWGLRKYSGEQELDWGDKRRCNDVFHHGNPCKHCEYWRGAYGLEPTIEMYVEHTVCILREIRRVLRPDGVVFWNVGDSYAGGGNYRGMSSYESLSDKQRSNRGATGIHQELGATRDKLTGFLKPKDLCLIPARVALAAQADGWWVRSMIIWTKPNPMPESVTDRPTDAYEHVIMLTKSERYYWNADAVRETSKGQNGAAANFARNTKEALMPGQSTKSHRTYRQPTLDSGYRNMRNVWTFATQPYAGTHFATFPEELPRRCILAATSAKGACRFCGTPWERITRSKFYGNWNPGPGSNGPQKVNAQKKDRKGEDFSQNWQQPDTVGWSPMCVCRGQRDRTVPCVVLDPFGGSGTTGRVAVELNRRAVLLDLAYHELAKKRTVAVQRMLV